MASYCAPIRRRCSERTCYLGVSQQGAILANDPVAVSAAQDQAASTTYDAFLSYTRADRVLVAAIQKALKRIGRRPGQLRALRVFRDDTDLEVSPDLWDKLAEHLDRARYLIVVLSPAAAQSTWVNREVAHWLARKGPEHLMMVLADGKLKWSAELECFDPTRSTAALPVLATPGALPGHPIFIDVSDDAPWDLNAPVFREKVTALAAPIHGKPKDQLASDDLRERRRFRQLRAAAFAALALLTVVSVVTAFIAVGQRRSALDQRNAAIATRLNAEAQAMLAGARPGGDVRAFQQLLAARTLAPPDEGALLSAVAEHTTTTKVVDMGERVFTVAASPRNDRLAIVGGNGLAQLWDLQRHNVIRELDGHEGNVRGAEFSPNGTVLVTADAETVHLWDPEDGALIRQFSTGGKRVMHLTVSPDGKLLATADIDKTVRLFALPEGAPVGEPLRGHDDGVVSAAFSPDNTRLASAAVDGTVRLWDVDTRTELVEPFVTNRADQMNSVAFDPSGRMLVAGDNNGNIWRLNPVTLRAVGDPVAGAPAFTGRIVFSPNGDRFVTAFSDGTVRLWNTETFRPTGGLLVGHRNVVTGATFSPDGRHVITGSNDGSLRIWDTGAVLDQHTDRVLTVAYSPKGTQLTTAGADGTVRRWDAATGQPMGAPMTGHAAKVTSVAYSPDGLRIASGGADHTVRLWAAHTGRPIGDPQVLGNKEVTSIAFSPNGEQLAISADDGRIRLWQPATGPLPPDDQGKGRPVERLVYSPDGTLLASASFYSGITLWDLATQTERAKLTMPTGHQALSVAFTPDGRRLVVGHDSAAISLWDNETHELLAGPTIAHKVSVWQVAVSPDGSRIASASNDGTVGLWDADELRLLSDPFRGHTKEIYDVAFSPDGRRIVTAGTDATARLWDVDATPEALCDKLSANMSEAEWRDWVSSEVPYVELCPGLPIKPD